MLFHRYLIEIFGSQFCDLEIKCNEPVASELAKNSSSTDDGGTRHDREKHTDACHARETCSESADAWETRHDAYSGAGDISETHDDAMSNREARHVAEHDGTDDWDEENTIDCLAADFPRSLAELASKLPFNLPAPDGFQARDNYTYRTRCGKSVRMRQNVDDLHLAVDEKTWDVFSDVSCSKKQVFDLGKSDMTLHIVTHMESSTSQDTLRQRFYKHSKCVKEKQDGVRLLVARSKKCAEDICDWKSSAVKSEPSCIIKQEYGVDKSLLDADHSRTEYASNCSSDSGIAVKSETSLCSPDVKPEAPVAAAAACGVKEEPAAGRPLDPNDQLLLSRLKRTWEESGLDNEEYRQDETPLCLLRDSQHEVASRCACVANILRSLSFIPGNDREMSRHCALIAVVGKLLLFGHVHQVRSHDERTFDREVDGESDDVIEHERTDWWWHTLDAVREDMLVLLANISGHMNLAVFPDQICMPVLDGLLHWSVCPSAYAHDPMPTMSRNSVLSPKKLVIETIAKLCVTETNVDLILAMPPFSRIVNVLSTLIKSIADAGDVVMRELCLAIVSYLVEGDAGAARAVALQHPAITLLLDFIEAAETRAAHFLKTHGSLPNPDSAELLGTSVDMLRKAASTLRALALVPQNQPLFLPKQERILNLLMSNCMDSKVVEYLSDVLFSCSQDTS